MPQVRCPPLVLSRQLELPQHEYLMLGMVASAVVFQHGQCFDLIPCDGCSNVKVSGCSLDVSPPRSSTKCLISRGASTSVHAILYGAGGHAGIYGQ